MEIIDRIVITILLVAAILRPTSADWIYGTAIVIIWIIWEGMILIVDKYVKKH